MNGMVSSYVFILETISVKQLCLESMIQSNEMRWH